MVERIDAELTLRKNNNGYLAELRMQQGEDSERRYGPFFVVFDDNELAALTMIPERYGEALSENLFQERGLVWALGEAYGKAQALGTGLRLRLLIDRGAPELQNIHWELLRIPGSSEGMSTSEDIYFSRYYPVRKEAPAPRPLSALRALVAISDPANIDQYDLSHIDVEEEKAAIHEGFADLHVDELPGQGEFCTLDLLARRVSGRDILYLLAHTRQAKTTAETAFFLQDASGNAKPIPIERLIKRLQGTRKLPRLVVLMGGNTISAAMALMNELGTPAVIAMQGLISLESARIFATTLFQELREDGAIDRAVAEARRAIAGRVDEWVPVLYMSLKSGQLWRNPQEKNAAFAGDTPETAPMPAPVPAEVTKDRKALYRALNSSAFTLADIEEMCFLLNVEWDLLKGQTQAEKARALITYFASRDKLAELAAAIHEARPNLKL